MELMLDIIEPQDGILFITGHVTKAGSIGDVLTKLSVFAPAKKRKQSPKRLSAIEVSLTIANIIVEGEPLDTIQADRTAQIGLTGDVEPVLILLKDHQWNERNGRYHLPRNETRMILLSGG
jgi:hypothetical protein